MTADSIGLIRRLAGGVRPFGPDDPAGPPDRISLDFQSMLSLARKGALHSGAPVRMTQGLANSLDPGTRDQLASAADAAAAEGITRALVLIEQRMFRLDVPARTIVDAPDPSEEVIAGIDGVVRRAATPPTAPNQPPDHRPARVVRNASLIDALSEIPQGD